MLEALAATGIPVVTGTTGWYDELPRVREAVEAGGSALLYAPNFSLGVALFRRWVERAARELEGLPDHDVAVMETHHAGKVDAPSGTARLLADTIVDATDRKDRWVLFPGGEDRASGAPLDPGVLRVSASRVGSVPGTHEVVLDGPDDQILLRHTARSRRGFARGALAAAEWIQGRQGLFTLDDMLRDRLGADSGTAARAGR
ncbi:MAG: dihydrodipicolinate reductase C-terminal domain-containing protein [Gemmatimonadota bacterium]